MSDIQIAEWILRLATSPDRAASISGDLAEEATARGVLWFWSNVLRTATSFLCRGLAENSLRLAAVASLALAIDIVMSLALAGLSGIEFFLAAWGGHQIDLHSIEWIILLDAPPLIVTLLIGRMLARLTPGCELSACLAYAILGSIFSVIMMFVDSGGLSLGGLSLVFLTDAAQRTPVLAVAVWGRHRRLTVRS